MTRAFLLGSALSMLALPALAQQPAPTDINANAVISYYRARTQQADDTAAEAVGRLVTAQTELAKAQKTLAEMQKGDGGPKAEMPSSPTMSKPSATP